MSERKFGETTDAYNLRQIKELEEALDSDAEEIKIPVEESTKIILDYEREKRKKLKKGSYRLGEIGRHEYRGNESPAFAARNALEKDARLLSLKEGAIVEIILLGYKIPGLDKIQGKKRDKRQKSDTRIISLGGNSIGIGACYKIKDEPHPDCGKYRWVVPAVEGENYPETLSEFLIADETCKKLTPEQRKSAIIEIQITSISEEDMEKIIGDNEKVEDSQRILENRIKTRKDEANSELANMLGLAEENPEPKKNNFDDLSDFKFF